jgi:hypothetical protein
MGMWVKREGGREGGVLIMVVFSSSETCKYRGRTIGRYCRDWTGRVTIVDVRRMPGMMPDDLPDMTRSDVLNIIMDVR